MKTHFFLGMLNLFQDQDWQFEPESGNICTPSGLILTTMSSVATIGDREHKMKIITSTLDN